MVFLNTCICLKPIQSDKEPCLLDIQLSNRQRISHIAVVSEAYVLEFFKEAEEYEITVHAELVDEFEGNTVYFAETPIVPATPEARIKVQKLFIRSYEFFVKYNEYSISVCENKK